MRYLFIGLAILLAIGAACAAGGYVLDAALEDIIMLLESSEEKYIDNNISSSLEDMERACELWKKHELLFDASTPRTMHSAASAALALLRDTLDDDPDRAHPLYAEALEALEHLRESERLSIENIL